MKNIDFNKLGLRLLMTIESYRRHRSIPFLLEERKKCIPILFPVYEELFEQLSRSLWALCYDENRELGEVDADAAELLEVIRKWEENVQRKAA